MRRSVGRPEGRQIGRRRLPVAAAGGDRRRGLGRRLGHWHRLLFTQCGPVGLALAAVGGHAIGCLPHLLEPLGELRIVCRGRNFKDNGLDRRIVGGRSITECRHAVFDTFVHGLRAQGRDDRDGRPYQSWQQQRFVLCLHDSSIGQTAHAARMTGHAARAMQICCA